MCPYDEKLEIIPQDDSFLDREPWDFQNTPRDRYPLLLFYHPLNIYRKQSDQTGGRGLGHVPAGRCFFHPRRRSATLISTIR